MSDHYYTPDPRSESDRHHIQLELYGRHLTFVTDAGVFSRRGLDYGSRLLIENIPVPLKGSVLDVGCGYGVIGIAVQLVSPEATVTMLDVNQRAVELTRENAALNGVPHIEVFESDGLHAVTGRRFDWILTNPPIRAGKRTVYRLFEQSWAALSGSGQLWLVMQKKQGAPSAVKKLQSLFADVSIVTRKKGYNIIRCKK